MLGYDTVSINYRSTFLDEAGGISVVKRFGTGELRDVDGELIALDDTGWAGPLVSGGQYFFTCTP